MTENENWFSEEDDDVLGEFLIEEPPDIDLILMPKLEIDEDKIIDEYYKKIKKCRNKEQLKSVLKSFYIYISNIAILQSDIQYLQDRAKELEFAIQELEKLKSTEN